LVASPAAAHASRCSPATAINEGPARPPETSPASANPSKQVATSSGRSEALDVTISGGSKDIAESVFN
jgi:hypothetical protein